MNRDEVNTVRYTASTNPFAAQGPATQMLRNGVPVAQPAPRQYDPKWDEATAAKPASEAPLTPEIDEKTPEIDVPQRSTDDLEAPKPVRNLKTLKPPKAKKEEKPVSPITESRSPEGLPSYRCEFEGRDIMVGFPCYKTTNPVTAFALIAMALDFGREKIRYEMSIGDAMVYHSRNRLAKQFLETDAKWLLMVDDDIIPSIGRPGWMRAWVPTKTKTMTDVPLQRHVLHRLIGSGRSLIGGAYFGRQENGALMCSDLSLASRAKAYEDAVLPVDWVATGCMLIHRTVFEDIQKKHPELRSTKPDGAFNFFQPKDDGRGEDVSFCLRAKGAGHQPHIDLGLPVFHVGFGIY
jgi:hypothetical protein